MKQFNASFKGTKRALKTSMKARLKLFFQEHPIIGVVAMTVWRALHHLKKFPGSAKYWEEVYAKGGTSGPGSYNRLADFKADIINSFVKKHGITQVIEFGCGDGNQLKLAQYENYVGFDVSRKAVDMCRAAFKSDVTKTFKVADEYSNEKSELSLSLDVIYHLIEDDVFDLYMRRLFKSSNKFVIIYSSDDETLNRMYGDYHVRHRKFTDWVVKYAYEWSLIESLPNKYKFVEADRNNTSFCDFFFYQKMP